MANPCYTNYIIEGDTSEIKHLGEIFKKVWDGDGEEMLPSAYGKHWLGNIVHLLKGSPKDIPCRGELASFYEYEEGDTSLLFATDTPWSEPSEFIEFIITKYTSLDYFFQAEESGCVYYVTNDVDKKHFTEEYIIDAGDRGIDYADNTKDLLVKVSDLLGKTVTLKTIDKVLKEHNEDTESRDAPEENITYSRIEVKDGKRKYEKGDIMMFSHGTLICLFEYLDEGSNNILPVQGTTLYLPPGKLSEDKENWVSYEAVSYKKGFCYLAGEQSKQIFAKLKGV